MVREPATQQTRLRPANQSAALLQQPSVQLVLAGLCLLVGLRAVVSESEKRRARPLGDLPEVTFRLDPNRADAVELSLLPGIGPTLAERIVSDRARQGSFGSVGELERVHGIGRVTAERLRPHLRIAPPEPPQGIEQARR